MPAKTPSKAQVGAAKTAQRQAARTPPPGWKDPLAQQQPLVSGRWLLRALLVVVGCAAVSTYLTLCLLFYQGQWQVVFHPSRAINGTPADVGLKYDNVRFDYTGTGLAQLAGWWIPAEGGARYTDRTVLFLHDGQGSLSDIVPRLKALHSLGVNVFAFDYRGFGQSMNVHPSEQRVYEDADAAWTYLTDIRHLNPKSIVLYGTGLGGTIAAEAAVRHREAAALVVENPAPPALSLIEADNRTHLLPIKWLFRDRFEIVPKLQALGVELSPSTAEIVARGTLSPSPILVRTQSQNGESAKFVLLLGPNPAADLRYAAIMEETLTGR